MSDSSSGRHLPGTVAAKADGGFVAGAENIEKELRQAGVPPHKVQTVMSVMTMYHSGPLPAVESFEGYERVCPGAARDILEMAKSQQKHRHKIERLEALFPLLGIFFGVGIVAVWLAAIVALAVNGLPYIAGALASGTGAAGLAGVFLRTRAQDPKPSPPTPANPKRRR